MVVQEAPEPGGLPPVAVFDWDNTCIRGDLSEAVLEALDEREHTHRFRTYVDMLREGREIEAYIYCTTALSGHTATALHTLAREVWEACLSDGRIAERPEIRDLISVLQRHGWEVWIVSASSEVLVRAVARAYGMDPDHVIGVGLAVAADGVLEDRLEGPFPHRQGKVDAILQRVGRRPVFAAGNADSDIEMLEAARYRLVMDSGFATLRQIAEERGWWAQTGW